MHQLGQPAGPDEDQAPAGAQTGASGRGHTRLEGLEAGPRCAGSNLGEHFTCRSAAQLDLCRSKPCIFLSLKLLVLLVMRAPMDRAIFTGFFYYLTAEFIYLFLKYKYMNSWRSLAGL